MPTRAIVCTHCGTEGEIEVKGVRSAVSPAKIFRDLGHNPFSGHMHFQCPACKIVLLVDPMAVLSDIPVPLLSRRSSPETTGKGRAAEVFQTGTGYWGIFRH